MHKGVDWVSPDTPVTEFAKLMREHDIGAIPIGENDRLIGMVTDRDIVCKEAMAGFGDATDALSPAPLSAETCGQFLAKYSHGPSQFRPSRGAGCDPRGVGNASVHIQTFSHG
jgi:hypothetical protein